MKRLFTIAALVVILVLNIPLIKNQTRKIKMAFIDVLNANQEPVAGMIDSANNTNSSLMDALINPVSPLSTNLQYMDANGNRITDAQYNSMGGNVLGENTTVPSAQNTLWGQLRGEKTTGINNIYGSANDAAINQQGAFGNSVIDNVEALRLGQRGIDRRSQQNEASRMQGNAGILGMIGRGIESGGRYLGNRNAGSSSAGAEIARAYGDMGRRQSSQVGNQFAQNEVGIKDAQDAQNVNTSKTKRDFHQGLMNTVNTIVESARTQLADLDSRMATSTLPDRIAIEQEKQRIKDAVLGHLQQYDSQLATGIDTIHTNTADENRSAAAGQIAAGTAAPNSFQYTDQMPGQFQNTGPFASGLPIFTNPIKKQQIA